MSEPAKLYVVVVDEHPISETNTHEIRIAYVDHCGVRERSARITIYPRALPSRNGYGTVQTPTKLYRIARGLITDSDFMAHTHTIQSFGRDSNEISCDVMYRLIRDISTCLVDSTDVEIVYDEGSRNFILTVECTFPNSRTVHRELRFVLLMDETPFSAP